MYWIIFFPNLNNLCKALHERLKKNGLILAQAKNIISNFFLRGDFVIEGIIKIGIVLKTRK